MFIHVSDEQNNTNLLLVWLVNKYKGNDSTNLIVGIATLIFKVALVRWLDY